MAELVYCRWVRCEIWIGWAERAVGVRTVAVRRGGDRAERGRWSNSFHKGKPSSLDPSALDSLGHPLSAQPPVHRHIMLPLVCRPEVLDVLLCHIPSPLSSTLPSRTHRQSPRAFMTS